MPVRFSYDDPRQATKSFSTKIGLGGFGSVFLGVSPDGTQLAVKKLEAIGQGGFGSVYLGVSPDGTQLAVKKLEAIGQGKKEFRAEVSTTGKVHHLHLVKLRGLRGLTDFLFMSTWSHGSLNKWIFKINEESQLLSWNTRFNIALGTEMGLAYLHLECEVKIVHCDIKSESVLLDDNFNAKVSDFGLAKLMTHEESRVYTALQRTRGYLAPEWTKSNLISEKTNVYSYGVVLHEIISGWRSYDPGDDSDKSHFPSYAFKTLEEGKPSEILDLLLDINENDASVVNLIKVALFCIQDEMHWRPAMTKVVQMLEGCCAVPQPTTPSQLNSQGCSSFVKWSSEEGNSTRTGGCR